MSSIITWNPISAAISRTTLECCFSLSCNYLIIILLIFSYDGSWTLMINNFILSSISLGIYGSSKTSFFVIGYFLMTGATHCLHMFIKFYAFSLISFLKFVTNSAQSHAFPDAGAKARSRAWHHSLQPTAQDLSTPSCTPRSRTETCAHHSPRREYPRSWRLLGRPHLSLPSARPERVIPVLEEEIGLACLCLYAFWLLAFAFLGNRADTHTTQ